MMHKSHENEYELQDADLQALLQDAYAGDPALQQAPARTARIMARVQQHANRDANTLADPILSVILQDAYVDDPALAEAPGRTARIMSHVRQQAVRQTDGLADPILAIILQDVYEDDPALAETPERAERIMRAVRLEAVRKKQDLADPALSAILQDAYADDPALMEAHGRAERIMRRILAIGGRWAAPRWSPFGWFAGATATAAVAVVLVLAFFQQTPKQQIAIDSPRPVSPGPVVPTEEKPALPPTVRKDNSVRPKKHFNNTVAPVENKPAVTVAVKAPVIPAGKQQPEAKAPRPEHPRQPERESAPVPEVQIAQLKPEPAAIAQENVQIRTAAALYSTGTTAQVMGDYETAYEAYQASYDAMPTPEALMASGDALSAMASESLSTEDSWL